MNPFRKITKRDVIEQDIHNAELKLLEAAKNREYWIALESMYTVQLHRLYEERTNLDHPTGVVLNLVPTGTGTPI
jgi:hypothetical protein